MTKILAIALALIALNFTSSTLVSAAVPPTNDVNTQKMRKQALDVEMVRLNSDIDGVAKDISVAETPEEKAELELKKTSLEAKRERLKEEYSALN